MKPNEKAAEWALKTTSARCLCDCSTCTVRECDYRSRVEAYLKGYGQAMLDIKEAQSQDSHFPGLL